MRTRLEPPPSDPEQGIYRGRRIARRFVSPDGFTVLVGKSAEDNDRLSLELCAPQDFWFHLAGDSGSHVVVRNPERLERLPRATERFAAALAAGYSKAKGAGRVAVHACRGEDVSKRRGQPPGEVTLARWSSLHVEPLRGEDLAAGGAG
ncbi:MAG: putative fibronectin-binding protein-like protein [Acidobacteria bacterium]|nr:putative fibronectin-binding protein-like protein [Acidobacteriota bacterium]